MTKGLNFGEAISKLEKIIEQLEEGVDDLDEIVKLFSEGSDLVKFCNTKLSEVELKIETISQNLSQKPTRNGINE